MKRRKSTGKPTKAEQARLDALKQMPCICREAEGLSQPSPTELHHLVHNGYRKHSGGHMATIPLCGWHHRAHQVVAGLHVATKFQLLGHFGPSLKHQGKKGGFTETWGTELELLDKVNAKLIENGLMVVK